jgi:hypothetical protein
VVSIAQNSPQIPDIAETLRLSVVRRIHSFGPNLNLK